MWKYMIVMMVLGSFLIAPAPFAQEEIDIAPDEVEAATAPEEAATAPEEEPATATLELNTEDEADEPGEEKKIGIAAALKVGGTFHTIFNELKPFVVLEIEGGILLLDRHLEVDLTVGWARPPVTYAGDDPRLTGTDFDWEIKQDFLSFGIMGRYRFLPKEKRLNVYVALGPRLFLMRSVTTGLSDGNDFGENRQYETRFGGAGALGMEINLGPGAILVEALMPFGNLDGFITGDQNSAALDLYAGYRFMF